MNAPFKAYRKKTVLIGVAQFRPEITPWPEGVYADPTSPTGYRIQTLEHTAAGFEVTPGDWIIRGVAGELYACKPDIFERTYEEEV